MNDIYNKHRLTLVRKLRIKVGNDKEITMSITNVKNPLHIVFIF